jgi:DNA-directed RNA polymerase subunit RPC12/RpoP
MSIGSMNRCLECGYEATPEEENWARVEHPPLGELTQCPECGSTNTHRRL